MIDIDDVNKFDPELDTVVDSLVNYLQERLSDDIDQFYSEWPEANLGENEVTLAAHTIDAALTNRKIVIVDKQDILNESVKAAATYRLGTYDINIQVDIWTPYKAKRNELYTKFCDTINEEFLNGDWKPVGLSLTLENYFDTIARYEIVGYNFPDEERASQVDEWRVVIAMKAHFDKKRQKIVNKITDSIIVDSDEITEEEYISEHIVIE